MFTGIVEELGHVAAVDGGRLRIAADVVTTDAGPGDSIAVDGCCLTVVALDPDRTWWEAEVSDETFRRTTLGSRQLGDAVNLERAVRLADRMGGHLVQGHVDAVGRIEVGVPDLRVHLPGGLGRYVVEKGSITVDGVSLTVVDIVEDAFTVAVIPHTADHTTLGQRPPGSAVNLEVDVMAKYAEKLLAGYDATARTGQGAHP